MALKKLLYVTSIVESGSCCKAIDKRNFRTRPWAGAKYEVKEGAKFRPGGRKGTGDKVWSNERENVEGKTYFIKVIAIPRLLDYWTTTRSERDMKTY